MINNSALKEGLDWALHILIAVLIAYLIVTFVAQKTIVYGESMEPTLKQGNHLMVEKISPRLGVFHHGDVVTIYAPEFVGEEKKTIIKRVIGIENDTIEIKEGTVYRNNKPLKEDYIKGNETFEVDSQYSKVTLKKGEIYVLGDNRIPGLSLDSRSIGPIDVKKVRGKVMIRVYPFNQIGTLKR